MIKDEFEEILELLEANKVQSIGNIQEILVKVFSFFRKVNSEFAVVTQTEKEELIQMLSSMQKKLQKKIESFCRESGITEDQLLQMADHTNAMTPQQKQLVEATRKEMSQISKNIKDHLTQKHSELGHSPIHADKSTSDPKKKVKRDRTAWKKS